MDFLHTATGTFDKTYGGNSTSWEKYINWSKLNHLTELVSLDGMLNELLVEPDYDNKDDWNYIHVIDLYQTGFFTSLDYVFKRLKAPNKFNLISAIIEPEKDCKNIHLDDYVLLDTSYSTKIFL